MSDRRLTGSEKKFYRSFSQHGSGDSLVLITPAEVAFLAYVAYDDLHGCYPGATPDEMRIICEKGLYHVAPQDVDALPPMSEVEAFEVIEAIGATDVTRPEYLYLSNLASIYRRRSKFYGILQTQAFPSADQIGPRCLLEYGRCDPGLLFAWMSWRKLAFDIDNRSAQETGYLFEPILASCLGGTPLSSQTSPVRRLDEFGRPTDEGRQVDCYVEEAKTAYELKMRVSIAASGQGRFAEELSFPVEAQAAGLTPVLIVFDPTPSDRLWDLQLAFEEAGGSSAVGDQAWSLLRRRAEKGMDTFIANYVEPPIKAARAGIPTSPEGISLRLEDGSLTITGEDGAKLTIPRR